VEGHVRENASRHPLLKTAIAIPAITTLAVISYAMHGSIAVVGLLYNSMLRRRRTAQEHLSAMPGPELSPTIPCDPPRIEYVTVWRDRANAGVSDVGAFGSQA